MKTAIQRKSSTLARRVLKTRWFPAFLLLAVVFLPARTARPQMQSGEAGVPSLLLGAAWYPEQWPESRWDKDLQLMEDAHLHVVRVGEFAWSTEEPAEGEYKLDWLARAIRLAEKHHIAVVLGTPTDAPPAWLTTKYPESLRVGADGRRDENGERRQFNYADPLYRRFCMEIVTRLARRFGHDPDVIGWQIGNEYTDESFDAGTRRQFDECDCRARVRGRRGLNGRKNYAPEICRRIGIIGCRFALFARGRPVCCGIHCEADCAISHPL
jgi:beta-galactosidase GanA